MGNFGPVGKDHTVLVRIIIAPVGQEFGHVVDIGVAAPQLVCAVGVINPNEK